MSIDTKTLSMQCDAARYDEEGVAAPRYIPAWVLPQEDLYNSMAARVGAAPDIVYARGVPADPTPDIDSIDRKDCSLILFEIGFCMDLGCHDTLAKKTEKYHPFLCAIRRYWGIVELVCIPIGHVGTTLHDTATDIATALAMACPSTAAKRTTQGQQTQDISKIALIHDTRIANTLLDKLCSLAQTRLLGIIANKQQKIRGQAIACATRGTQSATHEAPSNHLISTPRSPRTAIIR